MHPPAGHLPDSVLLAKQVPEYLNVMRTPCMAFTAGGPCAFDRVQGPDCPLLMQSARRGIAFAGVQDGLNLQALRMMCSRLLAHCWVGSCARAFLCSPSSTPPAATVAALATCLQDAAQLVARFTPALQKR